MPRKKKAARSWAKKGSTMQRILASKRQKNCKISPECETPIIINANHCKTGSGSPECNHERKTSDDVPALIVENNISDVDEHITERTIEDQPLNIEFCESNNDPTPETIGRRIIHVSYFFTALQKLSDHSGLFQCGLSSIKLISETRTGLRSLFKFEFQMCKETFYIRGDDNSALDVNTSAVAGSVVIGCGQSQLNQLCSSLDLPLLNSKLYYQKLRVVHKKWEEELTNSMNKAAEEERCAAIKEGRINADGIAMIDVIADGCWGKRSYQKNYSSLSGAATIIGRRTGKILFMGVKNKYCCVCTQASNKNLVPQEHECYKNYSGSSTGMESTILVEGFKKSIEMHNLIYARLISDGDASTYAKLLQSRPYPDVTVEKIECRNHLFRNMCNKLQSLTTDTRYLIKYRKLITRKRILTIRKIIVKAIEHHNGETVHKSADIHNGADFHTGVDKAIEHHNGETVHKSADIHNGADFHTGVDKAIEHHNGEKLHKNADIHNGADFHTGVDKVAALHADIMLAAKYAFGIHSRCKRYFCSIAGKNEGLVEKELFTNNIWQRITFILTHIAAHARSLIENVDSNVVERFHSIVAKLTGGKRINFALKFQYQMRCNVAALSFNSKNPLSLLHKSISGKSPGGLIRRFQERKRKQLEYASKIPRKKRRLFQENATNENYGDNCLKPDMTDDMLERSKKIFLNSLVKTDQERERITRETVLQSGSSEWLELRRRLLTASNFGRVIKRRMDVSCCNMVKDLLYKKPISHVKSVKHGLENELIAKKQLEQQEKIKISECGLFIDDEYPYLGATPDGIVDAVVEIKCPVTCFKLDFSEAIDKKKITFYKKISKDSLIINNEHNWWFQIQGQLHITKKKKCVLGIWFGENIPLKIEVIERNDHFWETKMKSKLISFYLDCILPELVDPRNTRSMPIRDPEYITKAIEVRNRKKNIAINVINTKENKPPKKRSPNTASISGEEKAFEGREKEPTIYEAIEARNKKENKNAETEQEPRSILKARQLCFEEF